jgi:ligand-binding sensor domain-containing protein/serine phosphatase RsbU (regulator of sigma subunit)
MKGKGIMFLFVSLLVPDAFDQDYNFRTFDAAQGIAQPYIYAIVQDSHGYLWIGTGNGLSRFNGFLFENYTTDDSLADNFITCGISDGESLWLGHMNGRVTCYDGKGFHPVIPAEANLSTVTHMTEDPEGKIWMSTFSDGLFRLDKKGIIPGSKLLIDQELIQSFEFVSDYELLVGTNTGLKLCRMNKSGEMDTVMQVSEIPESKIVCIRKARDRTGFYAATENDGIFKVNCDNNQVKVKRLDSEPDMSFTNIRDILEDIQGNLWLATFGEGLGRIDFNMDEGAQRMSFNTNSGFPSDNVKILFEDREGIIWSGNYGEGLTRITPKTFSFIAFDNPLNGHSIFSICHDPLYTWIGTEDGLVKMDRLTGQVLDFYGNGKDLPRDTVTAVYCASGKELWIGTDKSGVYRMRLQEDRIEKQNIGNGVLENSVTCITGKGDQTWIGTKKGLFHVGTDSGMGTWYTINQGGLPHNYIKSLYIDKEDRLWVSTNSSILAYILNEKVFKIPLNPGRGILTMGPMAEDADSRIWVGSNGNGVFIIGSDSVINLTKNEGLLSDYCYSLIADGQQNIWVGHKTGLSRISVKNFLVKALQQMDGISLECQFSPNATASDQHGKIWFGSDKGLICYDPSMELTQSVPPVLGITSIRVNDEKIMFNTNRLVLPPGNYKIRIDFLGISLKAPSLVAYQYKLEGFDEWSEITSGTSITYNHLNTGTFKFVLKASSGDGIVTESPLVFTIIIKKPVWKKWWFYLVDLLILSMIVIVYVMQREKKLLLEKRTLEEKVLERTCEIQRQKDEIELQRDIIKEKNANITSSIEYASHIQNAILPPLELVKRLLPDHFILNKPKDIVSGDFYWLAEKDNKVIFAVADCTGHGVPGAFMSLLGITLLNDIVNIDKITYSDAIIAALHRRIILSLQQNRKDITTYDGIDIALCILDRQNNQIQYTGAMNDLVYIHDGGMEIIKADYSAISALYDSNTTYTRNEIKVKKGDTLYLFSDGYQDQFGGSRDRKYLSNRFYNTLFEMHDLPMSDQKENLEIILQDWMKENVQTDDIMVMGIRL